MITAFSRWTNVGDRRFFRRRLALMLMLGGVVGFVAGSNSLPARAADFNGTITAGGPSVDVTLTTAGDTGWLAFTATAGERVFTNVSTGTLAGTGMYRVLLFATDAQGAVVGSAIGNSGYLFGNRVGFIDTSPALNAATYKLKVEPLGDTTGTTTVTLHDVPADVQAPITPNGASVAVNLNTAGQNGLLGFSAAAGQRVFVKMTTGTLSSASGAPDPNVEVRIIEDSNGASFSHAIALSNGTALLDTTTLDTAAGTHTYTLRIDPQGDATGQATVTLWNVPDDVTTPTSLDAPARRITLAVGQGARTPFAAAAGQTIRLAMSQTGMPNVAYQLYALNSDGSNGSRLINTMLFDTSSGTADATIGTTGMYAIVIDPVYEASGTPTTGVSVVGDAPVDAAALTTCGTTPVFRAEPVSGANPQYQFQVASDFGFASVVSDSGLQPNTNTFTPAPSTLANGQNYYWRWKTATGSWSSGRSFSVNPSHLGAGDGSPVWSNGPLAVNEVNGNLLVSLGGPGYPSVAGSLGASLSYNSLDPTDRGLGAGWLLDPGTTGSEPTMLIDHNLLTGTARVDAIEGVYSDGSSGCFTHVGQSNVYATAPGDGTQLSRNADGSWTYIDGDTVAGYGLASGATGQATLTSLQSTSTAAGNAVLSYTFSSVDPGKVTSVSDDSGRSVSFTWNSLNPSGCAAAVVCVTGPDGVTWRFVGDGSGGTSGRLATVNDGARDLAAVTYDGSGRVNKLRNADDLDPTHASPNYNGTHALTIGYDGSGRVANVNNGPITGQTPATSTWTFDYHPGSIATTATRATHGTLTAGTVRTAAGYTTVTPPRQQGQPTPKSVKSYYDGHGNVLERDDTLGNVTEAGYSSRDALIWSEDEDGNPTDISYDTVNDVPLSRTGPDPDGAGSLTRPLTSFRYDETNIGNATTAGPALQGLQGSYYDNSNLAGRPKLRQTDATVDAAWGSGGPAGLAVTDSFSVRWTGTITLPSTGSYTFSTVADDGTRLTVGSIVAVDDWNDHTVTTTSSQPTTYTAGTYKLALEYYDDSGPAEMHLRWACAGCSPAIADQVIPASALQPAWENQTSTVSPLGRMAFSHFLQPQTALADFVQTKLADGTNLITSYSYDSFGRTTQKVMPKGNAAATIDASGNLQGTPDSNYITSWTYYGLTETAAPPATCGGGTAVNQAGQLKAKSVHGLTDQTFVYDSGGHPIAQTKAVGTDCLHYDTAGEGRLLSEQAPGDAQPTSYSYDPAGNLLQATHTGTADSTVGTVTTNYDEAGRTIDVVDANGAEAASSYDADGNLISRHSATGLLASSTNYNGSYSYNDADQLTGETDPASRNYSFFYDHRGNLRGTQYPNGTFSWADTNPAGWLSDLLNRHGTINAATTTPPTDANPLADFAYQYNQDGQKTQEQRSGPTPTGTLTASGNEITDASRVTATAGDGRASPDSSYGLWEQTVNKMPNGGAESNTNSWINIGTAGSVTTTRDTTWAKFGSASVKVVTNGSATGQGVSGQTNTGLALAAGTVVTGSVWLKGSGTFTALLRITNTSGSTTDGTSKTITLSSTPQQISVTATVASGKTGNQAEIRLITTTAQAVSFWADGAQIETLPFASPYVQTDGATATRSAARIQGAASALSATQGWVALRIRTGLADSNISATRQPVLFQWKNDSTHYLKLSINGSKQWSLNRQNAAGAAVTAATGTFTAGTTFTVVATWTASQLRLSINGAAFTTPITNTSIPTLTASQFDIGSDGAGADLDGDILWFATGSGTLADTTTLNNFGNTDPTVAALPGSPTALWTADTSSYQTPTATGQTTTTYSYDNLGRLETVTLPDSSSSRYCYDLDSNRTSTTAQASAACGSANPTATYSYTTGANIGVDELTSQTGPTRSYGYDGDGNLSTRGSDALCWDGHGRISGEHFASSSCGSGSNTLAYSYDPAGELKSRVTSSPVSTTNYLLGDLYETNAAGSITSSYTDGPAGNLASFNGPPTTGSTAGYLYYSGHGDLAAEASQTGTSTATHTYTPFGSPNDAPPANATAHRYTGQWDKQYDTATSLVLMGARPYDPNLGRFLSVDPLEGGSLNNYDYAGQDPVDGYDLSGTMIDVEDNGGSVCRICPNAEHIALAPLGTILKRSAVAIGVAGAIIAGPEVAGLGAAAARLAMLRVSVEIAGRLAAGGGAAAGIGKSVLETYRQTQGPWWARGAGTATALMLNLRPQIAEATRVIRLAIVIAESARRYGR